jgi:hypothetical protein
MGGRKSGTGQHVGGSSSRSTRCLSEEDVLVPVSAKIHADDWPCFVLKQAVVLDDDGEVANLLHAEVIGPLVVRGKLHLDKGLRGCLRRCFSSPL